MSYFITDVFPSHIYFSLNDMFREFFSHLQVNKYLQKKSHISNFEKLMSFTPFIKGMCKLVTTAC